MSDYLIPLIVVGGFITSSFVDGVRIDKLEERLKAEIHAKAVAKANEVKTNTFNEMDKNITEMHNEDINELDSNDVIRFGN